jgi:hypothetical protein
MALFTGFVGVVDIGQSFNFSIFPRDGGPAVFNRGETYIKITFSTRDYIYF